MTQVPVTNGYADLIAQGWQLVEVLPWTACSGTTPVTSDVVSGLAAYRYLTTAVAVADNAIAVAGDMLRVITVPAETEEGSVAIKVTVFCN